MKIFIICAVTAAALFILFLYGIFLATFSKLPRFLRGRKLIYRSSQFDGVRARILESFEKLDTLPYRPCKTVSFDKTKLFARLYEGKNTDTVIIQMHGYRGNSVKDNCGISRYYMKKGYTILLPDQRAHENSSSHSLTFGIKERYDVLCWIDYIISLYGNSVKIVLSGVSMGAATVLMASGLDLPRNVKGVIADCPYTSPADIIKKVAKERGFTPSVFYPLIRLSAIIFGGFDPQEASPLSSLKNSKLPILIIHGDDDRFVPYSMGKALFDSYTGKKYFLTVKDAGHAFSYFFDTCSYEGALDDFLRKVL